MADSFCFVYVTCPHIAAAKKIAHKVVEKRLAACANILPQMHSIYRWKGRFCSDREVVLILKTRSSLFKKLEKSVRLAHPYTCPCIVALPLTKGHRQYLKWLSDNTR